MSESTQSPHDRTMFYTSCGFGGFSFVTLVSHLVTTYPEMRQGAGTIIGILISAVLIMSVLSMFITAYTLKKFDRTVVVISMAIGLLMLFILVVGLFVGAMV